MTLIKAINSIDKTLSQKKGNDSEFLRKRLPKIKAQKSFKKCLEEVQNDKR